MTERQPYAVLTLPAVFLGCLLLALAGFADTEKAASSPVATAASAAHVSPDLASLARQQPTRRVEVIVQVSRASPLGAVRRDVSRSGATLSRSVPLIHGFSATTTAGNAVGLARRPGIRAVTLNSTVEPKGLLKGKRAAYAASIGAPQLWNAEQPLTGRGVGVAVVDTGVAGKFVDFRVSRKNKLSRVRVSAVVNPKASSAHDHYGHGTHIAGLIGGNSTVRELDDPLYNGYIGVAPKSRLISIKASDDHGDTSVLDVIYGIQFAVDHKDDYNIRVLNLSLASTVAQSYKVDPLAAAAEAAWLKGIVVVTSSGNDGGEKTSVSYAPGNSPYVITVGAIDDKGTHNQGDDKLAGWSSRGITPDGHAKPDVLAPGAHMVAVVPRASTFRTLCPECIRDGDYFKVGGTSMSAAVVSGAVALLLEKHPDWTPDQVKQALVSTARDVPGAGRAIAVDAAVRARPSSTPQDFGRHPMLEATGDIDYNVAKWRVAKWRSLFSDDAHASSFTGSDWGCDCSLAGDGRVDPNAAKWRAASWRTSFNK